MVNKKRHILKALTWRLIASITTFLIGWIATGDIRAGLSIGVFDFSISTGFILYT